MHSDQTNPDILFELWYKLIYHHVVVIRKQRFVWQ